MSIPPSGVSSGSDEFPMVGRDSDLRLLWQCFSRCLDGYGGLVLTAGEAGIGKTSLVRGFSRMCAKQGAMILSGFSYDLTATPPYGPWQEITERYRQEAGTHLPELPEVLKRGTGMGDLRNQTELFAVARDFLFAVASIQPVIVILEDIHWSDQASLVLLRFLAREVNRQPILILVTYRDDEIVPDHPLHGLLPLLARESDAVRINIRPVSANDVDQLLGRCYQLSYRDRRRLGAYLVDHCDGNPMYVRDRAYAFLTKGHRKSSPSSRLRESTHRSPCKESL